jgi:Na+/proline symporter
VTNDQRERAALAEDGARQRAEIRLREFEKKALTLERWMVFAVCLSALALALICRGCL